MSFFFYILLLLDVYYPHGLAFTRRGCFLTKLAHSFLSHLCLSFCLPESLTCTSFHPSTSPGTSAVFLARTVLSVYTGLSPIFLFCTSLLFATSPFLTHFQSLEVGRCLPSGRGENRASTHNDKHGCVAFRKS